MASKDGRMFFIIPYGTESLIGTTDTKYWGDLDEVHADRTDVDYLLTECRRVLPGLDLGRESILFTYAGVRPLAFAGEKESRISRKHRVIPEGKSGRIITIAGGKYTTYRNMAEDVVDAVCGKLRVRRACVTDRRPLAGSLQVDLEEYLREAVPEMAERSGLGTETVRHLIGFYGSRTERLLEYVRDDPRLAETVSPETLDIYAQVALAVREEGAQTLRDIILRRMHLGMTPARGEPQIEKVAEVAARDLKWNGDEIKSQVEEFRKELEKERRY